MPTYREADRARAATLDQGGRGADASAAYAERVQGRADQVTRELQAAGYTSRDLDPATVRHAAESLHLGEHADPFTAYEAAAMRPGASSGRSRPADVPFPGEGQATVAASDMLPGGSPEAAETMRKARSLFAEHQRTFKPQGAGDDVGRAMRKIVDRNAEPVEVARTLYSGNPGLNLRMADRIKSVVGADSVDWHLHQQGLISSIVNGRDMSAKAIAGRIDDALRGPKRGLLYAVLDDGHIAGLRQFQRNVTSAEKARGEVPDWLNTLGRTDFDPNRITSDLFGSGVPGARAGSTQYAGALKKMLGPESPEWMGLRRASLDHLTMNRAGTAALPPRQMAERITAFTDGAGAGFARQMFEKEEIAELRRLGRAVQATVRPDGTALPEGTAHKLAGKAFDALVAGVGFHTGGIGGAVAGYGARMGQKWFQEGRNFRMVRRSLQGGAPVQRPELPPVNYRIGTGAGLVTGQL